jgi:hypothetical protein
MNGKYLKGGVVANMKVREGKLTFQLSWKQVKIGSGYLPNE